MVKYDSRKLSDRILNLIARRVYENTLGNTILTSEQINEVMVAAEQVHADIRKRLNAVSIGDIVLHEDHPDWGEGIVNNRTNSGKQLFVTFASHPHTAYPVYINVEKLIPKGETDHEI